MLELRVGRVFAFLGHKAKLILVKVKRRLWFIKKYFISRDAVTEQFFIANGLRLPRFGWQVEKSNRIFKTEEYKVVNSIQESTPRGLYITNPGRMGNLYIQIWNAANVAACLEIYYIFHDSDKLNNFRIGGIQFIRKPLRHCSEGILKGDFFFCEFLSKSNFQVPYWEIARVAFASSRSPLALRFLDKSYNQRYCCIHIRGGDVYSRLFPNPDYFQPNYSFYKKAILLSKEENFHIISEDLSSPLLMAVIDFIKALKLDVKFSENAFTEDVEILKNASSIIASNGTFLLPIIAANEKCETVYIEGPSRFLPAPLSCFLEDSPVIINPNYKICRKWKSGGYWINSACQRRALLGGQY